MKRHGSGHQIDDLADLRTFPKVYISTKLRKSPGYSAANQTVHGQRHPFHVDVLAVVSHRATHIHMTTAGTFRIVSRAMNLDILGLQAESAAPRSVAEAWH